MNDHIVKQPAEVVGAAWDAGIGTPEVVALIARMVSEGTLESDVKQEGTGGTTLKLRLKADVVPVGACVRPRPTSGRVVRGADAEPGRTESKPLDTGPFIDVLVVFW